MHMTRFGFNLLVVAYLAPLIAFDIIGNTLSTGTTSDYYYYKSMFDGLLIAFAVYQLMRPATAHVDVALAKKNDHNDDVVSFENIGAIEWAYCILLACYALVNWYNLHELNKAATGIESMLTLVWSFVSIAVAILAAVQFWHLKSGAVVELKKKVIQ